MAVIKLGQLLHRATTAPIDENNPLNVALSGNKASLLKSYVGTTDLISNAGFYYGNVASSNPLTAGPLDVSKYSKRWLVIRNKYDKDVIISNSSRLYLDSETPFPVFDFDPITILVNQTIFVEVPILCTMPAFGMTIALVRSSAISSGTLDLYVMGGN